MNDMQGSRSSSHAVDVMKNVFRPLCKSGMLLVVNMADVKEGRNPTGELVCQMMQCVDAMFEDEDDGDGGGVAGVLMGFKKEELLGPSIDPADSEEVEVSLPVRNVDLMDDDDDDDDSDDDDVDENEEARRHQVSPVHLLASHANLAR